MHIVLLAWIYVIGTMALTADTVRGGLAFFLFAGIGPVLVLLWLAQRRARARLRRAPSSMLEHEVRGADDGDAQADQR